MTRMPYLMILVFLMPINVFAQSRDCDSFKKFPFQSLQQLIKTNKTDPAFQAFFGKDFDEVTDAEIEHIERDVLICSSRLKMDVDQQAIFLRDTENFAREFYRIKNERQIEAAARSNPAVAASPQYIIKKSSEYEREQIQNLIMRMGAYLVADYCAKLSYSFSVAEVDFIKVETKRMTDASNLSKPQKDASWQLASSTFNGLRSSINFRNCKADRAQASYTFPGINQAEGSTNPF